VPHFAKAYSGFPVELAGAGELHAAFLNESRTHGGWWCPRAGNPDTWAENDGRSPTNAPCIDPVRCVGNKRRVAQVSLLRPGIRATNPTGKANPPFFVPTRISCQAAQDATACAAFIEESRMKFASATNLNRKSGVAQRSAVFSLPAHMLQL